MPQTTIRDVPTPALIVDLVKTHANIQSIADYARSHGIDYRPHTKTHKSVRIASMQKEVGAVGLTAAKVGEAQVFADVYDDLLIAYPALDRARTGPLARLAQTHTVRVAVDSALAVESLAAAAKTEDVTIGILVDIDTGGHRTGLQTPQLALDLAQLSDRTAGARFDGLFTYLGHVHEPPDQQGPSLAASNAILQETLDLYKDSGLACPIVSGGSSPTALQTHLMPAVNDLRCGMNVYQDRGLVENGYARREQCAASVVCTVVSNAVPDKCVLDAGSKALTQDLIRGDKRRGHGVIVEYPDATITHLTEEHAEVNLSGCARRPKLAERVTIIPNHICPVVNLFDHAWARDGGDELEPMPTEARGKLS
jgi:D-serine deaminase-like pyridoxal phosphate-dependent protein